MTSPPPNDVAAATLEARARELCYRLDLDERLGPTHYEIAVGAVTRFARAIRDEAIESAAEIAADQVDRAQNQYERNTAGRIASRIRALKGRRE